MIDCGHIFCVKCLVDFYGDAIKSGELLTVRCLAPTCAKERAAKIPKDATGRPTKKAKVFISPSELLQIGLPEETVKRYVTLKYKTELESDKNTIYCPRQWCNGAARSKRHKKPQGFNLIEIDVSDDDDDDGDDKEDDSSKSKNKKASKAKFNTAELLSVCDDCGFAFCSRCQQSWHGEFVRCTGKRSLEELTEEEKASLAYLELHTSPCPTCSAPAQKTHGCNHMVCSRCDSHFCYLCSAWLDPTNPYKHYNMQSDGKVTSCYMRLWELEGGDGDDIGLGFEGGQPPPAAPVRPRPEDDVLALPGEVDGDEVEDSEGEESVLGDNGAHGNNPSGDEAAPIEPRPAVAREAPLVLRVMDDPAARAARNEAQNAAAAQGDARPGRGRGGRGGHGDGNHRGNRGGARGGAVAAGPVRAAARGRGRAAPGRGRRLHNQQAEGQARHRQAVQVRPRQPMEQVEELDLEHGLLNAEQQAWVRRFVEMALEDMEEDGDSDDEDANFVMQ